MCALTFAGACPPVPAVSHSGISHRAAHSAHSGRSQHPGHPVHPGSPPAPGPTGPFAAAPHLWGSRPGILGAFPYTRPRRGRCEASPERGHNLTKVTERAGVGTRDLRPCGAAVPRAPLLPHPATGGTPASPNSSAPPRRLTPGSKSAPARHRPPLLGVPLGSARAQRPRALPRRLLRAGPRAGGPRRRRHHRGSPQTRPRRCLRLRRAPRGRRAAPIIYAAAAANQRRRRQLHALPLAGRGGRGGAWREVPLAAPGPL